MKQNKMIYLALCLLTLGLFTSCSDWTDMERVDDAVNKPWEQDPVLWAQYTEALRAYKKDTHFVAYVRLYNSPTVATSDKDFMRSLPDSLDMVSLLNADNFSDYDREDLPILHQKGTKVLYQIDYAARVAELSDAAKLGAYLDKVVALVKVEGLDGYAFTGTPNVDDPATVAASKLIVAKLSADDTKLLVFEGNPLFVAADDLSKIDFVVLDTYKSESVLDVRMQVLHALNYVQVPAEKLLLSAEAGAMLKDEERAEQTAITEIVKRVVSFGPLAGFAAYTLEKDYYHSGGNYTVIRDAIQTLNPSK